MTRVQPQVKHHGAHHHVTGSCHELYLTPQHSVLIDCGLFQGAETSGATPTDASQQIDFSLDAVQALVVTHTHIDHVGRIPYLLMAGFQQPIYCTKATAILLPLVIEDALKIGLTRNKARIAQVLKRLQSLLRPIAYDTWIPLYQSTTKTVAVQLRFRQAGHILGSAYAEFEWHHDSSSAEQLLPDGYRVVFSGDLGCRNTPLLPDPTPLERANLLFIESTYGDRLHESRASRMQRLQSIVERCVADGGAVLIPAFSMGRTQELLYEIEAIINDNQGFWPRITVILDSPMAAALTEHYQQLTELWDEEAKLRIEEGRKPLDFSRLHVVNTHSEHEHIVNFLSSTGEPCIVIAASGMCTGGRMVNYLRALLPDPRTDVLFVGYQAQGTPGRDIQRYGPKQGYVELAGERIPIRAGVHTLGGYSAHADQAELTDFIEQTTAGSVDEVRLIHGEAEAQQAFTQHLLQRGVHIVETE